MTDPSTSAIFGVSFLGALFAILVVLLAVYTYVILRLVPRLKRGLLDFVGEIGPEALLERANLDPAEVMHQLGVPPAQTPAAVAQGRAVPVEDAVRVIFTCEDHGRCVGCPRVLAQFDAIVRHQGEESFDDFERKCYAHLRRQLSGDAPLDGETETARQKRIAARVVDALVRAGYSERAAHSVVWSRRKEDRASFDAWLAAARAAPGFSLDALPPAGRSDEENVA